MIPALQIQLLDVISCDMLTLSYKDTSMKIQVSAMYQNNYSRDNNEDDNEWTLVPYGKKNGSTQYRKNWKYTKHNDTQPSLFGSLRPTMTGRQGPSFYSQPRIEGTHSNQGDSQNNDSEEVRSRNENYKKILCKNINNVGKCIYNNKCLYAHSLEEQNVESIRIVAYDIIKKDDDLSQIDLSKNKHLYNNLLSLTKECQQCLDGKCTGGYNCKHGACERKHVVCQTDLNKGTCDGTCEKVHLTQKGLVPYGVNILKKIKTKPQIPKPIVINNDFFKFLERNNKIDIDGSLSGLPDGKDNDKDNDKDNYQDNDSECFETYNEMLSHHMDDDSFCDLNFDCNLSREEKTKRSIFKIIQESCDHDAKNKN